VIDARLFISRCAVLTAAFAMPLWAQAAGGGLTSAQLQRLRQTNVPVVGVSPVPPGFHVKQAEPLPGGRSYRIVYANAAGATITFEAGQLGGSAAAKPTPAPKRGFLQKLFGTKAPKLPGTANTGTSGTSSETEGQGTSAIVADSALIGPIRFVPAGACLRGTNDASKAQLRSVQVRVSGCNFDDPDTLVAAYKHAHRF
jgi:hypothetical protein